MRFDTAATSTAVRVVAKDLWFSKVFRTRPVQGMFVTEKVAHPGGFESLGAECLVTGFFYSPASRTFLGDLTVSVPQLVANGTANSEDGISLTLEGLVDPQRQLSTEEGLALVLTLLKTLQGAHQVGLLHGALRPEQVHWKEDGTPLLAGLGAATDLQEWSADDPHPLIPGSQVPLKPWAVHGNTFAAPELRHAAEAEQGHLFATVRSELWSFAKLVLHFCGEAPEGTDRVLRQCLAEDPNERPESFAAVREQLEACLVGRRTPGLPSVRKASSDQSGFSVDLLRLVSERVTAAAMASTNPLEASAELRSLMYLFARSECVVGLQQAEARVREARALVQRLGGRPDHPEAAAAVYYIGLFQLRRGMLPEAEASLKESLRLGGSWAAKEEGAVLTSSVMAMAWQNLSSVLLRQGKLQEANESSTFSLRTWQAVCGDAPHPGVAAAHYHRGILLLERGETQAAEEMARLALDMALAIYGARHRSPAAAWHLLGSVQLRAARVPEAETSARHSLETRQHLYAGTAHPDTAASWLLLGSVLDRASRLDEAEEALLKALEMLTRLPGHDAALELTAAYRRLGSLRLVQGKPELAEKNMQEALKKSREVHGDRPHPDTIAALHTLAVLAFVRLRYCDARRLIEEAQQLQQALHGAGAETHPRTRDLQNLLQEIDDVEAGRKASPQLVLKKTQEQAPQLQELEASLRRCRELAADLAQRGDAAGLQSLKASMDQLAAALTGVHK